MDEERQIADLVPDLPAQAESKIVSLPAENEQPSANRSPGAKGDVPGELPVLPLRDAVAFPGTIMPLSVGRERSKRLVEQVARGNRLLVAVAQKDPDVDEPGPEHLYPVGTVCVVLKLLTLPDGGTNIITHGLTRCVIGSFVSTDPFLVARIDPREDATTTDPQIDALVHNARQLAQRMFELSPNVPEEARVVLNNIDTPGSVADFLAANLPVPTAEKQALLEAFDVPERLRRVALALTQQVEMLELSSKIQSEVQGQISKTQREYFLQEQMKVIQKELGESDGRTAELDRLRQCIEESRMPEAARNEAERELNRLARIPQASPEYSVALDYVTWLCELPWEISTEDHLNLNRAKRILDEDHHGLEKVKTRILEYLAVLKLKSEQISAAAAPAGRAKGPGTDGEPASETIQPDRTTTGGSPSRDQKEEKEGEKERSGDREIGSSGGESPDSHRPSAPKGPILCFIGPPGVGKTSLGQSIARALGRKFVRLSLGGIHDEAQLRGHRRTYIGAMPGRIIQEIRRAGANNPVFMLDEVDKIGHDFRGDPASALLEILDPAQNHSFNDNYIDVAFDLSRVMFIGTANYLEGIPEPLRDRMEIIRLSGYTTQDKIQIARKYLLPRQLQDTGLEKHQVVFEKEVLDRIATAYTREAGVRDLERQIGKICRAVAAKVARGRREPVIVSGKTLRSYLGPERFGREVAQRTSVPGVATGLAYTPAGGDILFIEATRMPGKGNLLLTGQIGDVMKESAQTAFSIARSKAEELDIDPQVLEKSDLHVHVPAGAVPKDGPSAGVSILTAIVSLLTQRPCRHDLAMTGEITLTGRVLPVGGIKEKVLAAHRAGIAQVILPADNRKDMEDIPSEIRKKLRFTFVDRVERVLKIALEPAPARKASGRAGAASAR